MKSTTIILAAVFALQVNVLCAGSEKTSLLCTTENCLAALAPTTPAEATFEANEAGAIEPGALVPAVPFEADFNDMVAVVAIDLVSLAPATPTEADFDDSCEAAGNAGDLGRSNKKP